MAASASLGHVVLFLSEKMQPIQIFGTVLVLSSAVLLQVTHRQQTEVPVTMAETV